MQERLFGNRRALPAGLAAGAAALTLLAAAAGPAPAASATSSADPRGEASSRERILQRQLDRATAAGVPGALLLVRDGNRSIRLASGYGDLRTRTAMDPTSRFRIGSVTKTFVATVVLQLAREGRLSVDDPVERWLPRQIPNGRAITIRQLLNHTSGLYDYTRGRSAGRAVRDRRRRWKPRELVAYATARPPTFAPGAGWSYSNTGYIVLGLTVEAATGNTIESEVERRILRPLHLRRTSFGEGTRIAGRHARGYVRLRGRFADVTVLDPSLAWAAGGMVSTSGEVARFYRALLGGRLLRPQELTAMTTAVPVADLPGAGYGLGLIRLPLPCGGTTWGHNGGIFGYGNQALNSSDGRRQVVMAVNSSSIGKRAAEALRRVAVTAACG
jgi:D-alanyl-D-alanine carboxypeptidase